MLIDTHAHINFNAYKDDGEAVLRRSLENGVWVVNVGSQYSTSKRAVDYAHKFPEGIYAAVGIHPIQLQAQSIEYRDSEELAPEEIKTTGEIFDYEKYLKLARDEKVVAIGEIGLDYHHFREEDDIPNLIQKQKEVFSQFIKLANEVEKPVMIHCWGSIPEGKAYDDLHEILKNNPVKKRGVIHSFVGSHKTAKKFIELGYAIGLNGIVTYGISYDRLIKEIDLENIILETDCPYLSPGIKKGERNEPMNVAMVAEKIALVKGVAIDLVEDQTSLSARNLFNF